MAKDFDGALGAMRSAYSGGHEGAAAQWALEAWRLKPEQKFDGVRGCGLCVQALTRVQPFR